ncbi:MAG: helix-turn-helix transcriptional regulator [Eubacterium sp.]|nr:helix-turn-helix transcriptional regulator [Eubacterium sp.]
MTYDYGKVRITLDDYMNKHQVSVSKLAYASEMERSQLRRYMNNEIQRVDIGVLSRICYSLGCEIGDIMKYETRNEGGNR